MKIRHVWRLCKYHVLTFAHELFVVSYSFSRMDLDIKEVGFWWFPFETAGITPCVYAKTILIFNVGEKWRNIYVAASRLGKCFVTIHADFK